MEIGQGLPMRGKRLKSMVEEALEACTPSAEYVVRTIYAEVQRLETENIRLKEELAEIREKGEKL